MSNTGEVARFSWVHRSTIQDAACLTFVRGVDADRVGRGFGAVTEHVQKLDFDEFCEEAFAHHDRYPVIGLRTGDGWTLVAEDGGLQGTRREVLRRVSAGTAAVSAFWDVNGLTRFSHAVDGSVRTSFEALMPDYRLGVAPDELEEVRAGLPWAGSGSQERGENSVELMLALAARITGCPLTPEWLEGDFLTYPVAPWPQDLPASPEELLDEVGLERIWPEHPDSAALLSEFRRAGPSRCGRAAVGVARYVLDVADGFGWPEVTETLRALETGAEFDAGRIGELVRLRRWELHRGPATSADRARVRALEVLRQATNDDPLTGLIGTLAEARRLRLEQGTITDLVRDALS